jgi:hypothetical protein
VRISRLELLDDPQFYQEFFNALTKAMFLAAQGVD